MGHDKKFAAFVARKRAIPGRVIWSLSRLDDGTVAYTGHGHDRKLVWIAFDEYATMGWVYGRTRKGRRKTVGWRPTVPAAKAAAAALLREGAQEPPPGLGGPRRPGRRVRRARGARVRRRGAARDPRDGAAMIGDKWRTRRAVLRWLDDTEATMAELCRVRGWKQPPPFPRELARVDPVFAVEALTALARAMRAKDAGGDPLAVFAEHLPEVRCPE